MILTDVGEVGIHSEGTDYILRPSLYAMSQLGQPAEIVELFARVMSDQPTLFDAVPVLWSCTEHDITELTGFHGPEGWVQGTMARVDVVHVARCLLKHGIVGVTDAKPKRGEDPKYVKEFKARDYVAMAIAHLGMSEREAWELTMTGLVTALRAKYPPDDRGPGAKAPSIEEHEATMEWYERVEAARAKQRTVH